MAEPQCRLGVEMEMQGAVDEGRDVVDEGHDDVNDGSDAIGGSPRR